MIEVLLAVLIVVAFMAAIAAVPAVILMLLLHVLAALTGWHVAFGFWVCYVMILIVELFLGA